MIVPAHDRQRGPGLQAAVVAAIAVCVGWGGAYSLAWFWFMFWHPVRFVDALVLFLSVHPTT